MKRIEFILIVVLASMDLSGQKISSATEINPDIQQVINGEDLILENALQVK